MTSGRCYPVFSKRFYEEKEIFSENRCILCGKSTAVCGLWFPWDIKYGYKVLQYGLCFRHFVMAQQDKHFLRLIESVIERWFLPRMDV